MLWLTKDGKPTKDGRPPFETPAPLLGNSQNMSTSSRGDAQPPKVPSSLPDTVYRNFFKSLPLHLLTQHMPPSKEILLEEENLSMERKFRSPQIHGDPDPGKSVLCYECKEFMAQIHCHPWSDPAQAAKPFGQISEHGPRHYRRFDAESRCMLCRMVWEIISLDVHRHPVPLADLSRYTYALKPTTFGYVYDSKPKEAFGQAVFTRVICSRWCIGIEINNQSRKKSHLEFKNIIHGAIRPLPRPFYLGRQDAPFAQRPFLHGRERPLQCDVQLLKTWRTLCDRHHGRQCVAKRSGTTPPMTLIDTVDQCIVSNRKIGAWLGNYVALSYVWGGGKQLYASTAEAYSALAKSGALLELNLSQTVSDAMLLVRKLGLRYLWVDALRIRHDGVSEKSEQIAQMGSIYQNALFTIVAASGEDCDAGLPGVRFGTRFKEQKSVQAGDITLLRSLQPGGRILTPKTSKWARRAWTFQEELLSHRQLIITDEQIWWRCNRATWCEDSQLETEDPTGFMLVGQSPMPPLEKRYSSLHYEEYFDLAAKYAQRQLSYTSDTLNAFTGVLSMLTQYSGEQFLWGIMTSSFARQLYWVGKAQIRAPAEKGYFPTWSWIGWEGEVSFKHYQTYDPVVTCFTLQEDGDHQKCAQISSNAPENSESHWGRGSKPHDAEVSIDAIKEAYPTKSLRPGFHIFFYTYSATFYLIPQGRLILPNLAPRYEYNTYAQLVGPKPDYGLLVPSLEGPELCEKGYQECILLGRRLPASRWDVKHVVVMLITRSNGIARRIGIADMSEEFWNLADRKCELICLG